MSNKYRINIAEVKPAGKTMMQTNHFAEVRLTATEYEDAYDLMISLIKAWPLPATPSHYYTFKLIETETREYSLDERNNKVG